MPMQVCSMWANCQEFSCCSELYVLTLDLGPCDDKGHANKAMVDVGASLGDLLLLWATFVDGHSTFGAWNVDGDTDQEIVVVGALIGDLPAPSWIFTFPLSWNWCWWFALHEILVRNGQSGRIAMVDVADPRRTNLSAVACSKSGQN